MPTLLDFIQNLPAVFLGQVEVEQDQMRPRDMGVLSLAPQKGHRIGTVWRDVQVDMCLAAPKSFPYELDIPGIIFDQEDFNRRSGRSNRFHHVLSRAGRQTCEDPLSGSSSVERGSYADRSLPIRNPDRTRWVSPHAPALRGLAG